MAHHRPTLTRRTLLGCGAAAAAVAVVGADGARAQGGSIPREQLMYVEKTKKPEQFCAKCTQWRGTPVSDYSELDEANPEQADCAIISGKVASTGWCGAYAPRG